MKYSRQLNQRNYSYKYCSIELPGVIGMVYNTKILYYKCVTTHVGIVPDSTFNVILSVAG